MSYSRTKNNFDKLVEKCINTSHKFADIPSKSQQHFYASVLFTRMCVIAKTLLSILPKDENGHFNHLLADSFFFRG